jgi:antitoxin CcdA
MALTQRTEAPKEPVSLVLGSDLVKLGKDLGLDLSSIAEAAIAQAIREAQAGSWLAENAEAIQAYDERVENWGIFSDGRRTF